MSDVWPLLNEEEGDTGQKGGTCTALNEEEGDTGRKGGTCTALNEEEGDTGRRGGTCTALNEEDFKRGIQVEREVLVLRNTTYQIQYEKTSLCVM